MTNNVLPGYSPVAEAERYLAAEAGASRLAAAHRLAGDPLWRSLTLTLTVRAEAVARHLDGAARALAAEGWTQGSYRRGGLCLFGALQRAAEDGYGDPAGTEQSTHRTAGRVLNLLIEARTGEPAWFPVWNDMPGRTYAEVAELVSDAAAFARTYR